MSEISKQALKVENNQQFPNNNAGLITPSNLRTFNEDMIDSTVNQSVYTTDSGSWNQQIGESVVTASLSGSDIVFEKGNGDTFLVNVVAGTVPPGTISGSAQVIAALPTGTVSGSSQVVLEDTTYTDNGNKSFLQTDGAGNLSFQYVDTIWETIRAGENVAKGTPLYISGSQGANPIVYAADASNPNKMPVTYIAGEAYTANTTYPAIVLGLIEGMDLTGYTAGQTVYVAEGGGWTTNLPSGSNSITQVLGIVTKPGNGGKGLVLNPGPASLPGLQTGYTWVGNGNNRAVAVSTGSIIPNLSGYATTGSNTFSGNQTITTSGDKSGVFYKSGSSDFFLGLNGNGNLTLSGSQESRLFEINKSSNWIEFYAPVINFNNGVSFRGNAQFRNIITDIGNGYVAQFDGFTASLQEGYAWVGKNGGTSIAVPTSSFAGGGSATWPVSGTPSGLVSGSSQLTASYDQRYALSGSGGGTTDISSLNAFTASQEILNAQFADTGSNTFNGNQIINGTFLTNLPTASSESQRNLFQLPTFVGANGTTYSSAYIALQDYASSGIDQNFTIEYADGSFQKYTGLIIGPTTSGAQGRIVIGTGNDYDYDEIGIVDNGNNTTTALFKADTIRIVGTTQLTGSLGVSGTITSGGSPVVTSIQTGSFATTGSNVFTGGQTIQVEGASITLQKNAQGSGSAYTGITSMVDTLTDPTNVFSAYQLYDQTAGVNFGFGYNSYAGNYPNQTVPMMFGGGFYDGQDGIFAVPASDRLDILKPTNFKYGADITGSVKLTPASVSTNASYPIPFISGSTLSKDSVDTLVYNPSTNQLIVSASTGQAQISPNVITFLSGSGVTTNSATLSKTAIVSTVETGYTIGISGNPSKIGAPSLASSTNPAIYAISSSGVPYTAIELQPSQSFTDGRVTAKRKLVGQQGFELTGSFTATIPTASSESQTNLFNFAPFVGANGTTYTSANISVQDYGSSGIDQQFVVEYANASFEKYTGLLVGPTTSGQKAGFTIGTGTGYDFDEISITDNGNNTTTALLKGDTIRIVGSTQVTGSLEVSGATTLAGGLTTRGGNLVVTGSILQSGGNSDLAGNLNVQSNLNVGLQLSATSSTAFFKDISIDDPNATTSLRLNNNFDGEFIGSRLNWLESGNKTEHIWAEENVELLLNGWGNTYDNALYLTAGNYGAEFSDWDGSYNRTPWLRVAPQGNPSFQRNVEVTGSVSISTVMTLKQQDPLPGGSVGQLAVSGSNLYFHNGSTWSQIN